MSDTQTPATTPKGKKRNRRSQSDVLVDSVLRMPLGELVKFAGTLASKDVETARFLCGRLTASIGGGGGINIRGDGGAS